MSQPPQFDAETQVLLAEVELGLDAQQFLGSKLGRYLVGCAQQEVKQAFVDFKAADPEDKKAITALQNRIWVAERFQQWIAEAIGNGTNAEHQIQQKESTGE